MPDRKDIVRLQHMLDAARDAIDFTRGKTKNALYSDRILSLSIVRCIEILGEAASKLSETCYNEFPQIPWKNIINMRNRLIHVYYDINLETVWSTITEDLPLPIIVSTPFSCSRSFLIRGF